MRCAVLIVCDYDLFGVSTGQKVCQITSQKYLMIRCLGIIHPQILPLTQMGIEKTKAMVEEVDKYNSVA